MTDNTARTTWKTEFRLISSICSKVASSVSATDLPPANPPTRCTSASSFPKCESTPSTTLRAACRLWISAFKARNVLSGNADCSIFRETPTTDAPLSKIARVTATPRPPLAPVTSTTLFLIGNTPLCLRIAWMPRIQCRFVQNSNPTRPLNGRRPRFRIGLARPAVKGLLRAGGNQRD